MGYSRRSTFAIAAAAVAAIGLAAPAHAQKTLRAVMHSDLKILDPIWTTAYIVRNHGYMVYDTLFATDANGEIKPQMVDKHEVSADQLTHTFTLRDGLAWHDGHAGHGRGLRGLHQALGRQGLDRPEADDVRRRPRGQGRQDLRHEAQGADRPRAARARQAVLQRSLHDAQARGRDRSQHADLRLHGLGPLRLQARRVEARRQDRLRQVRQVQAALRARLRPRRRQGGQGRPRRMARHLRPLSRRSTRCWPARSTSSRRRRTTCCRSALGDANVKYCRLEPAGQPVHLPAQLAAQAVRQSQGAPGPVVRLQPGGLPEGGGRRRRVLQDVQLLLPVRHAALQREGHGRAAEVRLQEGPGAAEGSRLRRHADRADALDRPGTCSPTWRRSPNR